MIILKNGTIYDGTGNKPYIGDIAIEGDKIVKVSSNNLTIENAEIIDCIGKCISPGFIDAHSHNDFFVGVKDNLKYYSNFIEQGVTTMVTGNCGFSAAGYLPGTSNNTLIGGGLFDNCGNDYSSFKEWTKLCDKNCPVNIISLEGHGTVRISLNGMSSSELNSDQLNQMEEIIDRSLSEGAAGVSLGLMYEPGQFAPRAELERVAQIVKKHNKVLAYHSRAMSKVSTSYTPPIGGRAHGLRAIDEVLEIARKTGVKTQLSHLIFVGEKSWGYVDEALKLLEDARAKGVDIMFDMYAMDFGASIITVVMPAWYLSLDEKGKNKPFNLLRLKLETAITKKALGFGFKDIMVSNTKGVMPEIEGKRVSELAKEWGVSEFNAYKRIVEKTGAHADVLMFKYANDEIIERLRVHPMALYMTDAWVTDQGVQNFAIYYNFPKFILLAKRTGTPIEEAINKMTGLTAERYGIKDRGIIAEGNKADITIFDIDKLSYKEQAEEAPKGIDYVFINGLPVLKDGKLIDKSAKAAGRFVKA